MRKKFVIVESEYMLISRDKYLQKLIDHEWNGAIKVITGIRRCGKSCLLFDIFKEYLLKKGINESQIIEIALDDDQFEECRIPEKLSEYIRNQITDNKKEYYVLLDEAQFAITDAEWKAKKDIKLYSILNGLLRKTNVDVYVTGSNSKFLSSDILTEFRGRGDEVNVRPLSFAEYYGAFSGDEESAWIEYMTYGGLPGILSMKDDEQKSTYLNRLFEETYIRDVIERYGFYDEDVLGELINILASQTGSLTNPNNLANTFKSVLHKNVSDKTIRTYIDALKDAFLVDESRRFDIKGKSFIGSPFKYYYKDIGLRNARLNFRQQDPGHLIENIIYNELCSRGYNVDVGVVKFSERGIHKTAEVDFICNQGNQRYYIQSAYEMPTKEKRIQEEKSLIHIPDSFKKIIVVKDNQKIWRDDNGITIMGIRQFLLDQSSLDL
jgi:predicted AAA+ superfamily ATPase